MSVSIPEPYRLGMPHLFVTKNRRKAVFSLKIGIYDKHFRGSYVVTSDSICVE